MDTQGGKQIEEGPEKRNGWKKVKEIGEWDADNGRLLKTDNT